MDVEQRARELLAAEYRNAGANPAACELMAGRASWPNQMALNAIVAALSPQASPGGQDALAEAVRRVISDVDSGDYHGEISEATYAALEAALAARQPVGSVPEWFELIIRDVCELDPEDPDAADTVCIRPLDLRLIMERHAAPPAQAVDLTPASIPDTPEVRDILGRPNFWCSPWANVLRMRGDAIPRKAEEEQAAVIRFMLNHYLANGADWAETAGAELDAIRKADSQAAGNG